MSDQHHLLLITTDQQRFDTIASAGAPWMRTPHLDWLCDTGIRFTRAYADCPVCIPSRYTIMTGNHAFRQATDFNPWNPSGFDRQATLPQLLGNAGYQTRAIGKMHFTPERDHLGFQHMELLEDYYRWAKARGLRPMDTGLGQNEMTPGIGTVHENDSVTRWIADRTCDFLDTRDRSRPFFAWTSFSKPHPPFDPPAAYWELYRDATLPGPRYGDWSQRPEDVPVCLRRPSFNLNQVDRFGPEVLRDMRRAYAALITQVDYNLGHIFARLRELDLDASTTIIFTTDHGEMLGDHFLGAKSVYLEGSAHLPFIIRPARKFLPDLATGTTSDALACLTDVLPTLLQAAGVPVTAGKDGRNLLDDVRHQRSREVIVGDFGDLHFATDGRFKYHWNAEGGDELLFDVASDPYEQRELLRKGEGAEAAHRLRAAMLAVLVETGNPHAAGGRLQAKPVRPLQRGGWPGFHSLVAPNDVCH